jgi:hypothetical protein
MIFRTIFGSKLQVFDFTSLWKKDIKNNSKFDVLFDIFALEKKYTKRNKKY